MHLRAMEAKNIMLSNLYPNHSPHWWPLVEDVLHSPPVCNLKQLMIRTLEQNDEFLAISIDATLKLCMIAQGQASYRAPAEVRNAACFDDAHSLRRILTVRGRTSAVLAMLPVPGEDVSRIVQALDAEFSPRSLQQVKFLSTDCPSSKLFTELKGVCPNLTCLCLDPVHLAIVYEYAQWGKRSPGSKVLRRILNRINQIDEDAAACSWGPFFQGHAPPSLSREEERVRKSILDKSMGAARARAIINGIDAEKPLYCRVTFIEGLAALCKYPTEVERKVTGTSKEVKKVLWAACSPERLEWLFNGARMRHSLTARERVLLPSGTSSNEALHAQINSWSKSIRNLHQSTL